MVPNAFQYFSMDVIIPEPIANNKKCVRLVQ